MGLYRFFCPIASALKTPDRLAFHYQAKAIYPDSIEVWRENKMLLRYDWINGEDAYPSSRLGRLHTLFKRSQRVKG